MNAPAHAPAPRAGRFAELDFFRGLVLLVIVVDHIGGSILSRVTLHAYALCDAAEVFVFLGGFATAIAYNSLAERQTEAVARQRFIRRAFEIYRAFLITAGLMLLITAALNALAIDGPNMPTNDLEGLLHKPLAALRDILLFRRQPYLASVLPMYAIFAALVPLARGKPWLLLAISLLGWLSARRIAGYLPGVDGMPWDFNPFAWQFLFVLGALCRCQPVYAALSRQPRGVLVTALAVAVVAAGAYYRLRIEPFPTDPAIKQNLGAVRLLNFLAIAWLAAKLVHLGWMHKVARAMPWIGTIGRQGLLCFVAGTGISLSVDSVLYWQTDGYLDVPLGLTADAVAIGLLYLVAKLYGPLAARLPFLRPRR
ncbi:OpgC domain-containing protein [Burkholderia gladioli]|uniref:OpgC domain-containing protein n=1 Tax=Burkholderia gladioli TaxID=28095 RepID=UPI0026514DBD|nr:OpgC domain-containing protein [Burkholderia gladioli]MDN8062500.1 OpgC domain-containing protein [Burkholderia gladioli]